MNKKDFEINNECLLEYLEELQLYIKSINRFFKHIKFNFNDPEVLRFKKVIPKIRTLISEEMSIDYNLNPSSNESGDKHYQNQYRRIIDSCLKILNRNIFFAKSIQECFDNLKEESPDFFHNLFNLIIQETGTDNINRIKNRLNEVMIYQRNSCMGMHCSNYDHTNNGVIALNILTRNIIELITQELIKQKVIKQEVIDG